MVFSSTHSPISPVRAVERFVVVVVVMWQDADTARACLGAVRRAPSLEVGTFHEGPGVVDIATCLAREGRESIEEGRSGWPVRLRDL
jgi:hypothetical protein